MVWTCDSNSRPSAQVLSMTPFVKVLVRWATGKRWADRLPEVKPFNTVARNLHSRILVTVFNLCALVNELRHLFYFLYEWVLDGDCFLFFIIAVGQVLYTLVQRFRRGVPVFFGAVKIRNSYHSLVVSSVTERAKGALLFLCYLVYRRAVPRQVLASFSTIVTGQPLQPRS